jgi:hypothetical protein
MSGASSRSDPTDHLLFRQMSIPSHIISGRFAET